MTLEALLVQALNGLASASGLFFVGAGLSLIFGVSRIINLAHGSLYMLGIYIAYSIATKVGGALGFWGAIVLAPLLVAAIGALIEILLLRRIYQVPELFQLLATFAVLLVINDATLWIWGNEDLFGPRAPGLSGSVEILNRRLPSYDLFLIAAGPVVLVGMHLVLTKTRFGRLIRAATQDREMVGALGVNQALLFTLVFAFGSALAGLGGALQLAREPATLAMDLVVLGDAFVVVVVGGMGSITGGLPRRDHHRRDQGALHRHWRRECVWLLAELLQTNAGRRIPGHGRGSDCPPLRADGPATDRRAQHGGRRGPAAPAAAAAHFRRASR